jgi:hypothetical protein
MNAFLSSKRIRSLLLQPLVFLVLFSVSISPVFGSIVPEETSDPTVFSQPTPVTQVQPIPSPTGGVDLQNPVPQQTYPTTTTGIPGSGLIKDIIGFGCSSIFNPLGIVENFDPTGVTGALSPPTPCDVLDPFLDIASGQSPFGKCGLNPACWIGAVPEILMHVIVKSAFQCAWGDLECVNVKWLAAIEGDPSARTGFIPQLAYIAGSLHSLDIPVGTAEYVAHLNPFAQAEASGFSDLTKAEPIFTIWKNARNAAYALSIVALVIVGFLIMFRTKIDAKTSISLTNTLPKIVIMLLLITFSFAIAGLMIDAARILMVVLRNIIGMDLADFGAFFVRIIFSIAIPVTFITFGGGALFGIFMGLLLAMIMFIAIMFIIIVIVYHMILRYAQFLVMMIFAPLIFLSIPFPKGMDYAKFWFQKELAYIMTIPISFALIGLAFQVANSTCLPSPFGTGLLGALAAPCGVISPEANPYGIFSFISPFIGLGILAMAMRAPSIADDLFGGHLGGGGHRGGGGHGLLGALLPLAALDEVGDIAKNYKTLGAPLRGAGNWLNSFAQGTSNRQTAARIGNVLRQAGGGGVNVTPGQAGLLKTFAGTPLPNSMGEMPGNANLMFSQAGFGPTDLRTKTPLQMVNETLQQFGLDPQDATGKPVKGRGYRNMMDRQMGVFRGVAGVAGRAMMDDDSRKAFEKAQKSGENYKTYVSNYVDGIMAGTGPMGGGRWEPSNQSPPPPTVFPRGALSRQGGFRGQRGAQPPTEEPEEEDRNP